MALTIKGIEAAKPKIDKAKVGKLLLAIETAMSEKCGLEVSTALRMAPYVFLRRMGGSRLGSRRVAHSRS